MNNCLNLDFCYWKCGLWISSTTWEIVRNTESGAHFKQNKNLHFRKILAIPIRVIFWKALLSGIVIVTEVAVTDRCLGYVDIPDPFWVVAIVMGFPGGSDSKKSAQNAGDLGFDHWVRKIHWRKEWLENCETWTWKGMKDSEVFLVVAIVAKMGIIKTSQHAKEIQKLNIQITERIYWWFGTPEKAKSW